MFNLELLKDSQLIKVLRKDEMDMLTSNITRVQYSMGESIVKNGEFVNHILFIEKGYVKIHSEYKNKPIIITLNRSGSFPGLSTMLGLHKHRLSVTAIDDTVVFLINVEIFRNLIENNGYFGMKVLEIVNESLLQFIEHNLMTLTYSNIHGRLAWILLYLSEHIFLSDHFDLLLSRKELSQFACISRENVIKVLYEFSHEGVIKLNSKNIKILQPGLLKHYAEIS